MFQSIIGFTEGQAKAIGVLIRDFQAIPYSWAKLGKTLYPAKICLTLGLVAIENINSIAFKMYNRRAIYSV